MNKDAFVKHRNVSHEDEYLPPREEVEEGEEFYEEHARPKHALPKFLRQLHDYPTY